MEPIATPPQPVVFKRSNPIIPVLLSILFLFLVAAGIGTYLVFGSKIIILPISPKDPLVKSFAPFYNFEIELSGIKNDPRGMIIIPKNNSTVYPEFIANKTVLIVFKNDQVELPAKPESLKQGDRLIITTGYDIDKKSWKINKIAIINPT